MNGKKGLGLENGQRDGKKREDSKSTQGREKRALNQAATPHPGRRSRSRLSESSIKIVRIIGQSCPSH